MTNPTSEANQLVVIIEDDVFLGKVLEQKIEEAGLKAKRFLNAEDGLAFFKNEIPDLLLLDIFLPGMNGLDALALIRKDEKIRNMPVLIVSNTDADRDRERAHDLNAQFLLKATTTPSEIIEHVRSILGQTKE